MNRILVLLIVIFFTDLVSAQNLIFYQRPQLSLTEYQKLYGENLAQDTKTFQLKGNIKSVTITLLNRELDEITSNSLGFDKKTNYFEIYKLDFSPDNKLVKYEVKWGIERNENTNYNSLIDTITESTIFLFSKQNGKLLTIESSHSSYGSQEGTINEKSFDSLGFLLQEVSFKTHANLEKEKIFHKKYNWNEKRNVMNYEFNYYNTDKIEHGKSSFKEETFEKPNHLGIMVHDGKLLNDPYCSTEFDMKGNIIHLLCLDPNTFGRSLFPLNYSITYKYNENNEVIERLKTGSIPTQYFPNEKTIFNFNNYDKQGNWQKMTIITKNDYKKYEKLEYKREILYY
ncbi:MAG: hypothetical protein H3C31_13785 [Brumimicrobium sp.]|nr:hypothetical protein [Brumimicrobium sp.]